MEFNIKFSMFMYFYLKLEMIHVNNFKTQILLLIIKT